MKFKTTVPYILFGLGLVFSASARGQNKNLGQRMPDLPRFEIQLPDMNAHLAKLEIDSKMPVFSETEYNNMVQISLDAKADDLIQGYIANMLQAQSKLKPLIGTSAYRSAVKQELPGAPVGSHCVYGQYTQLNRALKNQGDTLTIVPEAASRECHQFKAEMRKKYSATEYSGAIREGRMYQSDAEYQAALERYATRHNVKKSAPDSVWRAMEKQFAAHNFSADQLNPGTMLVVPRYRGSKTKLHMIMFLGRGRVENGKFIADENGMPVYAGHNREAVGYLFNAYDTSNVFAADTQVIARVKYSQEWARIESMSQKQLIDLLGANGNSRRDYLAGMSRPMLVQMARKLYFKKQIQQGQRIQQTTTIANYDVARHTQSTVVHANAKQRVI